MKMLKTFTALSFAIGVMFLGGADAKAYPDQTGGWNESCAGCHSTVPSGEDDTSDAPAAYPHSDDKGNDCLQSCHTHDDQALNGGADHGGSLDCGNCHEGAPSHYADTDGDGLTDEEEADLGTNPEWWDSDRDSMRDGYEVEMGTDPTRTDFATTELATQKIELIENPNAPGQWYAVGDPIVYNAENSVPAEVEKPQNGSLHFEDDYSWYYSAFSEVPADDTFTYQYITEDTNELVSQTVIISDGIELDTDGDGLTDDIEFILGTDPYSADTDADGLNDSVEYYYEGEDGDHYENLDPLNPDTDGDALMDGFEASEYGQSLGLNPARFTLPDAPTQYHMIVEMDENGVATGEIMGGIDFTKCTGVYVKFPSADNAEMQFDYETLTWTYSNPNEMPDFGDDGVDEIVFFYVNAEGEYSSQSLIITYPNDVEQIDTDGDGLTDEEELLLGTDPYSMDTDSDGIKDGDEKTEGTNPTNPDTDGDGVKDGEDPEPTNPSTELKPEDETDIEDNSNSKNPETSGTGIALTLGVSIVTVTGLVVTRKKK